MATDSIQHLDDIVIPDIEIDEGWPVSDIKTLDDCDDAYAVLAAAIATIEFDLELEDGNLSSRGPLWAAKARCALKYKKAALHLINSKQQRINKQMKREDHMRRERILLDHIRKSVGPVVFDAWVQNSGFCSEEMEQAA